jgi:hypothetical protein
MSRIQINQKHGGVPMSHKKKPEVPQRVTVFQQNGSGERKIAGVRKYAGDIISLEVVSIDDSLPPVIDDSSGLLPADLESDLVLDFLIHKDLSLDLAELCARKGIPIISSGKKTTTKWALTPPT